MAFSASSLGSVEVRIYAGWVESIHGEFVSVMEARQKRVGWVSGCSRQQSFWLRMQRSRGVDGLVEGERMSLKRECRRRGWSGRLCVF